MARFIYGSRNNIHIIDLQKTVKELNKALIYLKSVYELNKSVLYVGTTRQAQEAIVKESKRCGSPYVAERWLGGTLTNFETIRRSSQRLKELEIHKKKGVFGLMSKKEQITKEKDMKRLIRSLDGIKDMTEHPGCLFIIDASND